MEHRIIEHELVIGHNFITCYNNKFPFLDILVPALPLQGPAPLKLAPTNQKLG